jgi:DNA processing protein
MGGVSDDVLFARAFLNRVAEPACIPVWKMVRERGPVDAARAIRVGRVDDKVSEATAARAAHVDPGTDLEAADRRGMRLVVPESDEWPHFAFAALEAAGLRRLATYEQGQHKHSESGELIPPLALWIRGTSDLASVGVRSVAIVGARAATEYGARVATDLGYELALQNFVVVSGGAHGIDAAAHRGALSAGRETIVVSAGGIDRAYPPGNTALFERAAQAGLLVSESPPGSSPQRRRFLTRNRLIAALGTGTVVVEAARRSGAMNTATHSIGLGRPLMAVPGPVTSGASAGCHVLIAAERNPARLVTGTDDVLMAIGSATDLPAVYDGRSRGNELSDRLDLLDPPARQVFDGFPARGWVSPDRLAVATGLPPLVVIRALPILELHGLIEVSADGYRMLRSPGRTGAFDRPRTSDASVNVGAR